MFDKNFNIILGERASGRTIFLWKISKALKSMGYKICFIGCTNEFRQDDMFLTHFDFCRVLSQDDSQMVEVIKEKTERDKYDFIIVDDIDCVKKGIQKLIKSINIRKICTCFEIPILGEDFNLYKIRADYNDSDLESKSIVEYKGGILTHENFLTSLTREIKINSILNEFSR